MDENDNNSLIEEENGWKSIHKDVFRLPKYRELFCSIIGVGSQFLSIIIGIILFGLFGMFTVHHHGSLFVLTIILYAFTSSISGFISARFYQQLQGEYWT